MFNHRFYHYSHTWVSKTAAGIQKFLYQTVGTRSMGDPKKFRWVKFSQLAVQ